MRDIPGPTPGQEVTTPSSAGEAAAASADTSSHSTRHFACDLTMHSASLIPLNTVVPLEVGIPSRITNFVWAFDMT